MSIIKLLSKKNERILFTTPSHFQKAPFCNNLDCFYKWDYSEIDGFDNLANPKNSILVAQGKVSDILGTKQTFFITQGATTAILAAMKAIININDKVLVARNCHKSVFNGLVLTMANTSWFMPEINEDWGIYTVIDPNKLEATLKLDNYKVFIMTSPTYEGINSDIRKIASICKKYGVYLLIDEAHGSLNAFSDKLCDSAIKQGADISVNSLHKTAGALNQCAILNISPNIQNIDTDTFQKSVNLIHTTSPSYPLLSNIEACISYLNSKEGKNEIDGLINEISKFQKELQRFGVELYEEENHDPLKILVRKNGVSGFDLSETMFDKFNIEDELNNSISCLYLCGIGTSKQKLEKLKNALKKVPINQSFEFQKADFQPFPLLKLQPFETFNKKYIYINKQDSLLKISNKMILPYPPGIGLLYPGEAIQKWHLDYLNNDVEIIV